MAGSFARCADILRLDAAAESARIASAIRDALATQLRRKGLVVGVSGGIDSSVVAALCVRALGNDRVLALIMPERESSPASTDLGHKLAKSLGIRAVVEDITGVLDAAGCYRRRDDAVRLAVPEYTDAHKSKIVLPSVVDASPYALFSVIVQSPTGETRKVRLPLQAYLGIVAATNFKQRVRAMMEYYYADLFNFAVAGTPNRLEYALGFFVKNGDGAADLKPIAHLYKSQVYQLGEYLGIPDEILRRPPTTDTYSLEQSQEEFYFSLPLETMDLCLYGKEHGMTPQQVADLAGLELEQVVRTFAGIDSKRRVCEYLGMPPITL